MGNQHGNYHVFVEIFIIGVIIIEQYKKYSTEIEKQIVDEYLNGASTTSLKIKYGFKTNKSIIDKVKRYKGKEFVRTQREELHAQSKYIHIPFDTIDNNFKAYFIGLMSSDGYVNEEKQYVELSMTDEDVIKFVSNIFNKPYYKYERSGNRVPIYRVTLNDSQLISDLKRYGIVNKKSKILSGFDFTKEEIKYIPYFIRGLIDGDGWISKKGNEFFICSASQEFIIWLKSILEDYLFMNDINFIIKNDKDRTTMYVVRSGSIRNINILKDIIYDIPYGMQRKYLLIHDKPSETIMEAS